MKVALVSPYDYQRPGGVGEHVRHLAGELRSRGLEVAVLAPGGGRGGAEAAPGLMPLGRPIPVPANGSVARISLSFHLARRIRQILASQRFDVVHLHEPLMPALPVTVLRLNGEGANVGTFHAYARQNLGYYYGRPLLRRLFRRLDACIAVSEPAKTFVSRYFPADYTVIPNGVDSVAFHPGIPAAPVGHPRRRTILFLGRLEERKGLDTLLDAYQLLRQVRADCQLLVAGDGPLRRGYERRVEEEGIPDVRFLGFLPEAAKASYFTAADIYCAPNTGKESFGVILLEAMACGRAVVATAIDGFRQVLSDGQQGLLVPPGDEARMAAALARLLDHPQLRRQMGERGRLSAEGYAWPLVADRVLSVYEQALRLRTRSEVNPLVQQAAAGLR
ncbi:MAG: glycosyltransferase family 4 protein [Candidatus Dormibacteria bacterium]